jgi:hypothetical protein
MNNVHQLAGARRLDRRDQPVPASDDMHLLALAVARIEGKLDSALAVGIDHETRLRGLEANGCAGHTRSINEHALALAALTAALKDIADQANRNGTAISDLQQYRWKSAGVMAVASFVGFGGAAALAAALIH